MASAEGAPETRRRILIVTHDFPPLNSSASRRPYSWARTWTDLGHEVHVLTTAKYAHDHLTDAGQDMSGIHVHTVPYLPVGRPVDSPGRPMADAAAAKARKPGFIFDLLRRSTRRLRLGLGLFTEKTTLAFFALRSAGLGLLRRHRFDLLVSTSGPDVCPLVAGSLARTSDVFWLSDYRDLWFDEFAVNRFAITTWFVDKMQTRLLARADVVSTVSRGLAGYLEKIVPGKVTVCYNGYLDAPSLPARAATSGGPFNLVYTGTFYPAKRDPAIFFDGMRELLTAHPQLRTAMQVHLYGPAESWVATQVSERGLGDVVRLHGSVTYAASLEAQRNADALMFVDWMDDRAEGVLTGKLFEYLACAVPILCIGTRTSTEAASTIESCGAGRVAINPPQVRESLESLLAGGWALQTDREMVAQFSRREQAKNLLALCLGRL